MHNGKDIGSLFKVLFRFVKFVFRAKAVGKEALKTCTNITIDIINNEPEHPVSVIFKDRLSEAKVNLEEKI